jgi:hypothetical protein
MENTQKPYNPAARIALYSWLAAIVGIIVFFLPVFFTIDSQSGAPALYFLSIIIFVSAVVCGIVFSRMAGIFNNMFNSKDLLAHWTYSKEEWDRYTESEHIRDRKEKWSLFRVIAIIALVVGVGFVIVKHDAWPVMLVVIPGLIAVIAFTAFISIASTYRRNQKHPGEVYIGTKGAVFQRSLHYWKLPESYLRSVEFVPGDEPYLEIEYSGQSGIARAYYTTRIPVPKGRENEAKEILNVLSPKKNNEKL